jgi:hypothetical protein
MILIGEDNSRISGLSMVGLGSFAMQRSIDRSGIDVKSDRDGFHAENAVYSEWANEEKLNHLLNGNGRKR